MATLALFKTFAVNMTDYIARHNANYALIEDFANLLAAMLPGATSSALQVPEGLQEIFDRAGLIGVDSYAFSEGTLGSPYNLAVGAGAFWNGVDFLKKATSTDVSLSGLATGTYYLYLDASGVPGVSATLQPNSLYTFDWDSSTHAVSNKILITSILFDGTDYAAMLTSTTRTKSFTKVADRLEEIEQLVSALGGYYGEDAPNHSGLDFAYLAGKVRNDSAIYDTAADKVTLTDNTTNYIEVDPTDGTVSANTTSFTSGQVPLFIVVTASGEISTVTDQRTWAVAGTGGEGGGGHTQNTDTGTTGSTFTLDSDAAGTPTGRVRLIVENGAALNAEVAFNRDTGIWEYTTDGGSTWKAFGEFSGATGAEVSQYVPIEDPILVLEDLTRSTSADYEDLDVTAHVTAPDGLQAIALLVYFWDSSPGAGVNVKFRKKDSIAAPVSGFTVWSGQTDPGLRIVPVNADDICQFFVTASGVDTANIRIYLMGYYKKVSAVGPQGIQGIQGIQGEQGEQGDPGTTVDTTKVFTGVTVGAGATVQSNLTGFITRGLAHYIKIEETGGSVTGTYDVKIYDGDDFSIIIYELEGVDPATDWEDSLPWMFIDKDASNELHIEITNNDGSNSGTYVVTIRAEKFA